MRKCRNGYEERDCTQKMIGGVFLRADRLKRGTGIWSVMNRRLGDLAQLRRGWISWVGKHLTSRTSLHFKYTPLWTLPHCGIPLLLYGNRPDGNTEFFAFKLILRLWVVWNSDPQFSFLRALLMLNWNYLRIVELRIINGGNFFNVQLHLRIVLFSRKLTQYCEGGRVLR